MLFNDPFDVPRSLELPFTNTELRVALAARFEAYITGAAVPCAEPALSIVKSVVGDGPTGQRLMLDIIDDALHLLTVPLELAMEHFRSSWLQKIRHLRILCLSAVSDSATMWAHYADGHKGVVLQFESSDERDSVFLLATPVRYRSERPSLPFVDRWTRVFLGEEEVDWSEYFNECYYVKRDEWRYEHEYRAVSASLDDAELYYDSPFDREDLRGIILGTAISEADESAIRHLAESYSNAIIYRAQLDHDARQIVYVQQ